MSLSQGDRLGRYEVLGPIGAGGMGEVWRARDNELDREVAVKVLPESFADDPNRLERFQREAKALAALSHPNLLDIYDVGSTNGLHYAVTELLEGDTLRERITPTGLPWQKVTGIGAAVADGLAAAHGRGIVHRDLKPENLFLTADGRVKILDFGLAAVHEEASPDAKTATITEAGTVMGTPGYMSPEQVKGQQADARSDIFSLGCVLYEMVSGHRAFGGDTGAEVIANILKEEPPQLSSSGAAVPVDLERAVHRCLEKRPEARFQSAADLAYSLKSVGHSGTAPVMATPQPSTVTDVGERRRLRWQIAAAALLIVAAAIASWWALTRGDGGQEPASTAVEMVPNRLVVAPFENRTGDPSLDPVGVLAADRIAQRLAEVKPPRAPGFETGVEIVPTSRLSELLTPDSPVTVTAVAEATGARIVVTGSYVCNGETIELDAIVNDAATGQIVRVLEPVAAPRSDPGQAVATLGDRCYIVVTDHLSPVMGVFADRQFPSIEAYELLLTGMKLIRANHYDEAIPRAKETMEKYPNFNRVRAWMLLPARTEEEARPLIDDLLQRSEQLTESQLLLIAAKEAELEGNRESEYRLWRDLNERAPDNPMVAWFTMGRAVATNRPGAALDLFERFRDSLGEDANPTNRGILRLGAAACHLLGRFDEELAIAQRLRGIVPGNLAPILAEARALAALGRLDEVETLVTTVKPQQQAETQAGILMLWLSRFLDAHDHSDAAQAMAINAVDWFTNEGGNPTAMHCDPCLGWAHLAAFEYGKALEVSDRLLEAEPDNRSYLAAAGVIAANLDDRDTVSAMDARLKELGDPPGSLGSTAYSRACIAAQAGEPDSALRLLREALSEGFSFNVDIHSDPDLKPLWQDPEFQEIMRPKG